MNSGEQADKRPTGEGTTPVSALHETIDSREPLPLDGDDSFPLNDRYELTRVHAVGGMGRVWVARDKVLDRLVALKDIRPDRSSDEEVKSRFLMEAKITGRLEHPGIVPVYELIDNADGDTAYYTMRLLSGSTLSETISDYHTKRLDSKHEEAEFQALLNAFVMVCRTVAYAHSRGIVHRDLKGQNVILGDFGEVVLLDWGLAKDLSVETSGAFSESHSTEIVERPGLTIVGEVLGTPAYMAPEQAAGRIDLINPSTDVYGLGAILYEILTGRPVFTGSNAKEILHKVLSQAPVPPCEFNTHVPAWLERVCLRALNKEAATRYQSAVDLADEVERWQEIQRKQAEKALLESEALYHSLVEALPIALVRKDLEGRITYTNDKSAAFFQASPDEVIGKTVADFFSGRMGEESDAEDRQVITTGETLIDVFVVEIDGETRYFTSRKGPVRNEDGEITGVQSIFWDITQQRETELALIEERKKLLAATSRNRDNDS